MQFPLGETLFLTTGLLGTSSIVGALVGTPLHGALVRLRADYRPRMLGLALGDDNESEVDPLGPPRRGVGYFRMLGRTKRLEVRGGGVGVVRSGADGCVLSAGMGRAVQGRVCVSFLTRTRRRLQD